jgi:hypothetical protein
VVFFKICIFKEAIIIESELATRLVLYI